MRAGPLPAAGVGEKTDGYARDGVKAPPSLASKESWEAGKVVSQPPLVQPVLAMPVKRVGSGQASVGGAAGVAEPLGVGGVASEDSGQREWDPARGSAVGLVQGSVSVHI